MDNIEEALTFIDEKGVAWRRFSCEYRMVDGSMWTFELWATSFADAENRLLAIASTGRLMGELEAVIPA